MDHTLQIVLTIVLTAVAAFLISLILQLQRTAQAVQLLAESLREDTRQITRDIHEVRLQVDRTAALVERTLAGPATAGKMASTALQGALGLFGRGPGALVDGLVTALRIGLDFVRWRRRAASRKEKTDE
ncbi:MAG TPA: hypothetical protein VK188_03750 [Holophaga sp.]|nr:hypothetical protein [Holophaga sp.]